MWLWVKRSKLIVQASSSPTLRKEREGWGTLIKLVPIKTAQNKGGAPGRPLLTWLHSGGKTTSKSQGQTSNLRLRKRPRERVDQNRFVEILILSDR